MITYYSLKDDDVMQLGDEWTIDSANGVWYALTTYSQCIGQTPKDWDLSTHCCSGWEVRRKIVKTPKGNIL